MNEVLEWKNTGSLERTGRGHKEEESPSDSDHLEFVELGLGMDEELTETLWMRFKGRAGADGITGGVCYRLPDQEDSVQPSVDS